MSKFTAFVLLVALRICYHPSHAPSAITPFTSASPDRSSREVSLYPPPTTPVTPVNHHRSKGSKGNHKPGAQRAIEDQNDHPSYERNSDKKIYYCNKGSNQFLQDESAFIAGVRSDINKLNQ